MRRHFKRRRTNFPEYDLRGENIKLSFSNLEKIVPKTKVKFSSKGAALAHWPQQISVRVKGRIKEGGKEFLSNTASNIPLLFQKKTSDRKKKKI